MIPADQIRRRVAEALPDAVIDLRDTAGDADHYEMVVVSSAFSGRPTLERHRMVYAALKDVLGGALHALALKTLAPDEPGARTERTD